MSDAFADLASVLDTVAAFVRRYVVLGDAQLVAVALWTFHTHALAAADVTPYLTITSAEKRCGKSLLQETLLPLAHAGISTLNISDAAMFRVVTDRKPTLFFDEVDSVFGPKARDREDLRGMLNGGWRRGAVCYRVNGATMSLQSFAVFCPKAFAMIGELPDTIADRSIPIRMEPRTRDQQIERARVRERDVAAEPIRRSIENLAKRYRIELRDARPELPDELNDRAQDVWEPLLAIADLAGDGWPERARAAAVSLSGQTRDNDSLGVTLLRDIYAVFHADGAPQRIKTSDLIARLSEIEESPWGDWYGKPISAQGLSRLLKPYRIRTMPVKVEGIAVRGYKVEQFASAWERFVPLPGVTRVTLVTSESASQKGSNAGNAGNAEVVPPDEVERLAALCRAGESDESATTEEEDDEW